MLRVFDMPRLLVRLPQCWTVNEERAAWAPPHPAYGDWGPTTLFVLLLGLVYSAIAPVMLPIALLFFSFGFVVFRYQLLYVYLSAYQARRPAALCRATPAAPRRRVTADEVGIVLED